MNCFLLGTADTTELWSVTDNEPLPISSVEKTREITVHTAFLKLFFSKASAITELKLTILS